MSDNKEFGRPAGDEKLEMSPDDILHDHDVLGGGQVSKEEAMHMGELTAEERSLELKLRRKIDLLIMPLVILVGKRMVRCVALRQSLNKIWVFRFTL